MNPPALLFVCLGNICRSPLAEAAFRQEAARAGMGVLADSAGTGSWHVGEPPDPRARAEALRHGIDISGLRARLVEPGDFDRFDHVLALDASVLDDLRRLFPTRGRARLSLLLDHVSGMEGCSVADPYWGGADDFAATWKQVDRAAKALVQMLSR